MKIGEFLDLCAGKWFSQRSSYHLDTIKVDNCKSELTIEKLPQEHPEVITLCQHYQVNPGETLGGTKSLWDNSVDWGKPKQIGFAMIVLVPDRDNPQIGKLLRAAGTLSKTPLAGCYILGNDEALTLIVEEENTYLEERLWFASPNLRLRTSLVKNSQGFSKTAFYSEIRRVAPKSPS